MGEHQAKSCVIADSADVAEMVGNALKLRHHSPHAVHAR